MFVQPLMGLVMVMASNICFSNHAYSIVRVWAVFQKYIVSFKELLFSSSIGISNDRQHCWAQPDFTKPFGLVTLNRSFLAVEILFVMLKLVLCVCRGEAVRLHHVWQEVFSALPPGETQHHSYGYASVEYTQPTYRIPTHTCAWFG